MWWGFAVLASAVMLHYCRSVGNSEADCQISEMGPMHSMRAGAYHPSDLIEDQTEALARTSPPVQSSSSCAPSEPQHIPAAFPTQVVNRLQEYYNDGIHYPSQNLKLKLAIEMVRHASTFLLILDTLRRVSIRDAT